MLRERDRDTERESTVAVRDVTEDGAVISMEMVLFDEYWLG